MKCNHPPKEGEGELREIPKYSSSDAEKGVDITNNVALFPVFFLNSISSRLTKFHAIFYLPKHANLYIPYLDINIDDNSHR